MTSPGDPPAPTMQQQLERLAGAQLPPHPRSPRLTSPPWQAGDKQTGRTNGAETQPRQSLLLCQLALLGPALIHAHQLHPFPGTLGFSLSDLSTAKPSWLVFSAGTLWRPEHLQALMAGVPCWEAERQRGRCSLEAKKAGFQQRVRGNEENSCLV